MHALCMWRLALVQKGRREEWQRITEGTNCDCSCNYRAGKKVHDPPPPPPVRPDCSPRPLKTLRHILPNFNEQKNANLRRTARSAEQRQEWAGQLLAWT